MIPREFFCKYEVRSASVNIAGTGVFFAGDLSNLPGAEHPVANTLAMKKTKR